MCRRRRFYFFLFLGGEREMRDDGWKKNRVTMTKEVTMLEKKVFVDLRANCERQRDRLFSKRQ